MTYAEGEVGGLGNEHTGRSRRAAGVETADISHDEVREQLSYFLAGELDESQQARLAAHLAECVACAAFRATFRQTVQLLGTLPSRPPPRGLRDRLRAIADEDSSAD